MPVRAEPDSDAERISAAHHAGEAQVSYHLLVEAGGMHGAEGPLATLGIAPVDTFGSDAAAQSVSFAVTHGELLSSTEGLVRATGSQEVVVVASSATFPGLALPAWQAKASERLGAVRVQVIEHAA